MSDNPNLPQFKYSPNCYENKNVFEQAKSGEVGTCQCCGKQTEYYRGMYAAEDVDHVCPDCIFSGAAAKKFNGQFIQDAEPIENSTEKVDELFHRTPGYISWQGEMWLVHCNDYCAFIGDVGTKELEEMGIADEVFDDYAKMDEYDIKDVRQYLVKEGNMAGYLFQCLHCMKYRLWVDAD